MKRLEALRKNKALTQRALGKMANVAAADICKAEKRCLMLYPSQAVRIADSLGWEGDPMELFEEVEDREGGDA